MERPAALSTHRLGTPSLIELVRADLESSVHPNYRRYSDARFGEPEHDGAGTWSGAPAVAIARR